MPIQFLLAMDEIRNSISKLTLGQTTLIENITILLSQENEKRLHEEQEILKRIGIKGEILADRERINETNVLENVDSEEEKSEKRIRRRNEMMRNRQATTAQESPVRRIEGIQAKDVIRAFKSINVQYDMGVEDFIKTILRIKNQ